jgi:hypothetical protein
MRRVLVLIVGVALVLATLGAWLYTLLDPDRFGECHSVALYLGRQATIRDCQPYQTTLFAVPIGLIAVLFPFLLYLTGDTNVEFPFFGKTVLVTRRGKEAVEVLQAGPDLDQRGHEWLEVLSEDAP